MYILTMGESYRGTVANITTYDVSRFHTRVHEYVHMDLMIQPYVKLAGFGHISKIMSWSMDNKFILALYERWRLETHIFWFPTGECTVTLEGVYMLLGLPIEGKVVNRKTNNANSICMDLLDVDLLDDNSRGQGSGSSMHVMYLPLLRHVDRIGSYSWGSACLAYLYSFLCKNSHKDTSTFSGCAVLL
ncbi:hypothetical protein KIW84_070759 [Lathyrus oleraceus]|uniref:Aminotransferase-like plant mobile domain-containing protein n=1 Tax=Pisum sativum TaxID=3888 RepID=A0A9D4ZSA9_PEA|nr:hypothetical protein KIW84_070759 [Pisum sativum]